MASPPSLSSYGLPTTFSNRPQSTNPQSLSYSARGRGQNAHGRGRGRGNGGNSGRGGRGGFIYDGRSNQGHRGGYSSGHGDMRTGLFKDSFLEDPWKNLVGRKPIPFEQSAELHTSRSITEDSHVPTKDEDDGGLGDGSDVEGEIVLPEDDDELEESTVGLGDGIVDAARKAT
jgi:hypothetical protein